MRRWSLLERRAELEAGRPSLAPPIALLGTGGGLAVIGALSGLIAIFNSLLAQAQLNDYSACFQFNGPYCGGGPVLDPDNRPFIAAGVLAVLASAAIVAGVTLLVRAVIGRRGANEEIEQLDAALEAQ